MGKPRFLMCAPAYFGVEYVINPWMKGQVHGTDTVLATRQWCQLRELISSSGVVSLLPPIEGLPDLVFTANAALIYKKTAVLSSFRCAERQPEEQHFAKWLETEGYRVVALPPGIYFEGAGDALLDRAQPLLWAGYGFRSDLAAHPLLQAAIELEVQPLRLRDPRFYHLDTCFCPLQGGYLLYYDGAFDEAGNQAIEARVPAGKRLSLPESDAVRFACNAVNIGEQVFMNDVGESTAGWLKERGFQVRTTALSEFMKAGGAAKCLSLRLDEEYGTPYSE